MPRTALWLLALLCLAAASAAGPSLASHQDRFSQYEGTKTCLECHRGRAESAHASVHYQWLGDSSRMTNPPGPLAGKLGGINDFCIYPDINWIGRLTNLDGAQVDGGCAKCHVGSGLKPSAQASQEQLENIDCLVCHAPGYKRAIKEVDGALKFTPDEAAMGMSATQAAWQVARPTNESCLSCHANGGGGNNYKRGDISQAMLAPSKDLDVHLASGMSCLDCHIASDHRIAGRGVDLRPIDSNAPVSCLNCHGEAPHSNTDLNRHTGRVDCTVCHIPTFARQTPTEMTRDWASSGDVHASTRLYEPHGQFQSNVTPVYKFFNGKSSFYRFGDSAQPSASGRVVMAQPEGSISESGVKLHAFKRHLGNQPMDPVTKALLPIKIGVFFQYGDIEEAVRQGVAALGWADHGYTFQATERYMGIYHQVAPANRAVSCSQCHGGSRIDFKGLGYAPKESRKGKPLCLSCHGDESEDRAGGTYFYDVHQEHAREQGINCAECHGFSATSTQPAGGGEGDDDDEEEDEDEDEDREEDEEDEDEKKEEDD
jgi:hypothetical protein